MGDKFIPGVPSIDSAMQVIGNVARNAVGNPSVPLKAPLLPTVLWIQINQPMVHIILLLRTMASKNLQTILRLPQTI